MPPPQYTPLSNPLAQKGKGKEEDVQSGVRLNLSGGMVTPASAYAVRYPSQIHQAHPVVSLGPATSSLQTAASQMKHTPQVTNGGAAGAAADEEDDADELPVMSDDVYGQGLLWQSQSKDNLKVLMDNFTPEQFERYEAYRRSALPKQSVRKAIQQSTNYTLSQPVAQVVAGFAKVFVGEIVEKARQVQARQGDPPDTPLSPEHLREAYRLYQEETGKVGAARVNKGKKLFVR
ncbi:TAFII28-domain-containing protein [Ramaria rubella]|nr:TAFII28-domain-containing protein [Ramaria rubella]